MVIKANVLYFTCRVSVAPAGPSVPLDLWRDSTSMPLENWSLSLNRISWTVLVSAKDLVLSHVV